MDDTYCKPVPQTEIILIINFRRQKLILVAKVNRIPCRSMG